MWARDAGEVGAAAAAELLVAVKLLGVKDAYVEVSDVDASERCSKLVSRVASQFKKELDGRVAMSLIYAGASKPSRDEEARRLGDEPLDPLQPLRDVIGAGASTAYFLVKVAGVLAAAAVAPLPPPPLYGAFSRSIATVVGMRSQPLLFAGTNARLYMCVFVCVIYQAPAS